MCERQARRYLTRWHENALLRQAIHRIRKCHEFAFHRSRVELELHRVVAIASGALDSLPHNGYVVTTIRAVCGETHARAYPAVAMTTLLVPVIGTIVAIALFTIF